jgi:hypothetical protein
VGGQAEASAAGDVGSSSPARRSLGERGGSVICWLREVLNEGQRGRRLALTVSPFLLQLTVVIEDAQVQQHLSDVQGLCRPWRWG